MKARLTPAARADIQSAASWYESHRAGLGGEFVDRVMEGIGKIEHAPLAYAAKIEDARRCPLRQFPSYGIWFRVENEALVIGCISGKRDARLVRERAHGITPMPKPPEPS